MKSFAKSQQTLMSIVVGIVMFAVISLFGEIYLRSGSPSQVTLTQALGYLYWMRFTILIMPVQMLIGAAVYYDGDEGISNIANAVQGLGNIIFSIVLSHFMGIRGIGLASFLFNMISLLIFLLHFKKESNSLRFSFYFSFSLLKDVSDTVLLIPVPICFSLFLLPCSISMLPRILVRST